MSREAFRRTVPAARLLGFEAQIYHFLAVWPLGLVSPFVKCAQYHELSGIVINIMLLNVLAYDHVFSKHYMFLFPSIVKWGGGQ